MHCNNSSISALYHALDLRCQSTLQTNNSKQFGIEALYRWRAGPGEEAICPRSRAESEAQLETLLMNAGSWSRSSSPSSPPPSHAHTKTKPKSGETAMEQRSHLPSKAQGVHTDNLPYRWDAGRVGRLSLQIAVAETKRIGR